MKNAGKKLESLKVAVMEYRESLEERGTKIARHELYRGLCQFLGLTPQIKLNFIQPLRWILLHQIAR